MKKYFIPILLSAIFLDTRAGVLTVNNKAGGPGQYTSLQTAIDSAAAGDSIYVHGSATSYGNVTVRKRLNFFGTGHNPNKPNNLVSEIGNVQLDTLNSVSGASGSSFTGFKVNRITGYSGSGGTKNILIRRNYFISGGTKVTVSGTGWILENNILSSSSVNANNNGVLTIRNNIFNSCNFITSNQPSVLIANNIFFGTAAAFNTVSNAIIANNIFSGATPKGTGINTNTFSNNLTYQTTYDTIPFGTNGGSGNFVAQNPLFTNVAANSFNYAYDYSLQAGSPGKNSGTDGTDLGIYGGAAPFVDLTGSPALPLMQSVTILNPMIQVGDSLRVIIKARKQD